MNFGAKPIQNYEWCLLNDIIVEQFPHEIIADVLKRFEIGVVKNVSENDVIKLLFYSILYLDFRTLKLLFETYKIKLYKENLN